MSKLYAGNDVERLQGLELLLANCRGKTVLDIGNAKGLVTYEFARRGAKRCDGCDINTIAVEFCRELFVDYPIDSQFYCLDLATHPYLLDYRFPDQYDIVLFLGVWKKIEAQMDSDVRFNRLLESIVSKSREYLAIRTSSEKGMAYRPSGFDLFFTSNIPSGPVANVNVFKRSG